MRPHAGNPAPALEAAFARIERERMAGLPLLNPALRVQAVGLARWHGHWLGALITPWFLNLVLVPGSTEGWRSAPEGARVFHRFPAGDFAFLGNAEPELGEFQSCSLISPVPDFASQASACATARAALQMLKVEQPAAALRGMQSAPRQDAPVVTSRPAEAPVPTRRSLLFGLRGR